MSTLLLPLPTGLDRFSIRPTLDEVEYLLKFAWNGRDSVVQVSIYTSDETALVVGQVGVVDMPLFRRFADTRLPKGFLMLQDTSGDRLEIGVMDDLGDRVKLIYIPEADL